MGLIIANKQIIATCCNIQNVTTHRVSSFQQLSPARVLSLDLCKPVTNSAGRSSYHLLEVKAAFRLFIKGLLGCASAVIGYQHLSWWTRRQNQVKTCNLECIPFINPAAHSMLLSNHSTFDPTKRINKCYISGEQNCTNCSAIFIAREYFIGKVMRIESLCWEPKPTFGLCMTWLPLVVHVFQVSVPIKLPKNLRTGSICLRTKSCIVLPLCVVQVFSSSRSK